MPYGHRGEFLAGLLKEAGLPARAFTSTKDFLQSGDQHQTARLIRDIRMRGMSGLDLNARLNAEQCRIHLRARPRRNRHGLGDDRPTATRQKHRRSRVIDAERTPR